jgi:hypothetical protein
MVNYEEALMKPFTDMKKLIIGIVLSLIPIVNFTVVTGYAIESSGVGKTKQSKNMPEWKGWWHLFVKGLTAIVIKIVYLIPAIAVLSIAVGLAMGDIANTLLGTVVTPEIMSQMQMTDNTPQEVRNMFGQNWYLVLPSIIRVAPIFAIGFLLALMATFLTPIAVLNYAKNKRFSAAFDVSAVVRKALTGQYILTWLAVIIFGVVLGLVLSFIPFVGPAIALFVVGIIAYSLYGQAYVEA